MGKIQTFDSQSTGHSKVELRSINVDAVVDLLRSSTSYFRTVSQTGDDIVTQCPYHGMGNEKHPSFGICNNRNNPNYGLFHCFTCNSNGNILQLVNYIYNKEANSDFAVNFIKGVSDIAFTDYRNIVRIEARTPAAPPTVTEAELLSYKDQKSNYLTNRHVKPLIQRVFDCGFDTVDNSVTFPVKRMDGSVYFIVRRKVEYKWYSYPPGVEKPVYGMYEFSKIFPQARSVVIVESVINALTLWGYQIPAVALLGTGSQTQIDFLNTCDIRHYTLCLDGDNAGLRGTQKLQKKLKAYTSAIYMPPGYDVNDVDEQTMRILYMLRK